MDSMDTSPDTFQDGALSAEEIKTQANEEYKAGRYADAARRVSCFLIVCAKTTSTSKALYLPKPSSNLDLHPTPTFPNPPLSLLTPLTTALAHSNATYYSNRSAALMMLKKYKEAVADCRLATDLDPTMVKAFLRAGKCQLILGNLPESQRQYQLASAIEPANQQAQKEMAVLSSVGNYVNQAQLFIEYKQHALAINNLDRAISMVDGEVVPMKWRVMKAQCYLGQKNYSEAGNIAR
ncbi:hypothetical protein BC938DRAFT_470843 [Jimgerdemannia flammicorona]|uniref:Uncharacterized protein n=1 Tax=Jimgerdemannia flammicorona TaxID=994334 RepID=A0A433R033_9FUNG|nr:hypothetical protein BC938DRAFT_470843 [Jimgerdemannia flammicorona]